jgi:transposase-like protein
MATRSRKLYQPSEKVAIVRRHLIDGVQISDLCDEYGLQPTQYYQWQKQLFENGELAFQRKRQDRHEQNRYEKKIGQLEGKIQEKNEVIAELLEEHVQLKKAIGEP